jgi:hypothetical protein
MRGKESDADQSLLSATKTSAIATGFNISSSCVPQQQQTRGESSALVSGSIRPPQSQYSLAGAATLLPILQLLILKVRKNHAPDACLSNHGQEPESAKEKTAMQGFLPADTLLPVL